jgi:DNA-binding transcriptional LysR family regulator
VNQPEPVAHTLPQAELEIRLSDQVVDVVEDGAHVAIRIGQLPDCSLIAAPTAFALCESPKYLAARGVPGHPDDLHHHDMIGHVAPDAAIRFDYRFTVDGAVRTMNLPSRPTLNNGQALDAMGGAR